MGFKINFLTEDEEALLLKALDGGDKEYRNKASVLFLLNTGLRIGELTKLEQKDVKDGLLRLKPEITKTKKARAIPLNETARAAWELMWMEKGPPRNIRSFEIIIQLAAKKAGIGRKVTPHTLRHTFATRLVQCEKPTVVIQELLGHANISTTQIYAGVTLLDEMRAVDSLDGKSSFKKELQEMIKRKRAAMDMALDSIGRGMRANVCEPVCDFYKESEGREKAEEGKK